MVRKLVVGGVMGLFGAGVAGMVGAGVVGLVAAAQEPPGRAVTTATRYVVHFENGRHGVAAMVAFDTRAEAEKFAALKRDHGYAVRVAAAL